MKQMIIIALALLLTSLASSALADRYHRYDGYSGHHDRGERIGHRLDMKGDRIERRFDHQADRAADRGHYRKAYRLNQKGDRINRRLDRKGDRFERRYERRSHFARHHHPNHRAGSYGRHYQGYNDRVRLGVFVPGFWLSGTWRD